MRVWKPRSQAESQPALLVGFCEAFDLSDVQHVSCLPRDIVGSSRNRRADGAADELGEYVPGYSVALKSAVNRVRVDGSRW